MKDDVMNSIDINGSLTRGLMMVGLCLKNSIGSGKGPSLVYATPEQLRLVKIPHPEAVACLKNVHGQSEIHDCWIWNTCNRFEVYAVTEGNTESCEESLLAAFFDELPGDADCLNILHGEEVIHHLLRTLSGLNSGLPGETDVEGQFECSLKVAEACQTIREETLSALECIMDVAKSARFQTHWSDFTPSYCLAALEGALARTDRGQILSGPVTIIGSSNTSRSCVEHLEGHFGVNPGQITFFHRCQKGNGTVKSIRRASMGCHRRKVDDYDSLEVREAIAHSTLVIFGIDRNQPILSGDELASLRKGADHPIALLDFNTLGSTQDLNSNGKITFLDAQALEKEVQRYAERMQTRPGFREAAAEIEIFIATVLEMAKLKSDGAAPCLNADAVGAMN